MKTLALFPLIAACTLTSVTAADSPEKKSEATSKKNAENPRGTRVYPVALFKRGPKWSQDSTPESQQLQRDHIAYLGRLEREGKITLAGAFTDRGLYQSMIIFRIESVDEARALIKDMPAVKAERLVFELHPWMSADGIRIIQPRIGNPVPGTKPPAKDATPKKE